MVTLALLDCQFLGYTERLLQEQPLGNEIMESFLLAFLLAVREIVLEGGHKKA
jgi:hypothetical protein